MRVVEEETWLTIIASNYLAFARVLADSLARVHNRRLRVVITDAFAPIEDEPFDVWTMSDIGAPVHWAFQHGRKELAAALKPLALRHALDCGAAATIFIDPDMLVTGRLDHLVDAVRESPILLSPHLVRPVPGRQGRRVEREILRAGVFNGGLIGVSESPEARRFLAWWQARIDESCGHDLDDGVHFDQRWLDFVPSLFPTSRCLRDEGLNVGWWRLVGRRFDVHDGEIFVDGGHCSLLHMSGFRPTAPSVPCLYYPELLSFDDLGEQAGTVFGAYADACLNAGFVETQFTSGRWSTFDDGTIIPDAARMIFRQLGDRRMLFANPFSSSGSGTFQEWLVEPVDSEQPEVTRFWLELHDRRPDIQEAYPDPLGVDRRRFVEWIAAWGEPELVRPYLLDDPAFDDPASDDPGSAR